MDMTGYLGKKVDVRCGEKMFSGYVFDAFDAEDSDIGKDCIEVSLLDREAVVVLAIEDIDEITVDENYRPYPMPI